MTDKFEPHIVICFDLGSLHIDTEATPKELAAFRDWLREQLHSLGDECYAD